MYKVKEKIKKKLKKIRLKYMFLSYHSQQRNDVFPAKFEEDRRSVTCHVLNDVKKAVST